MRFVLHDDPEHAFSEAIGVVMEATGDRVCILTKRGERVEVDVRDIQAAKVFP